MGIFLSITAMASDYTAQCKMDNTSYVVASQGENTPIIELRGYGRAENCTVIVTVLSPNNPSDTKTYRANISNGYGSVDLVTGGYRLMKVENIVCYAPAP